ncbi:GDSL-type esterase/lipase family protein [Mesomycoplasma ovipneumoniae]|uniref:GDSL-type esterase/lipase family protein n=1 Tax=Mesomycoplasma ovipneumoniae TaxID=29562 RepID=A0AAW6Q3V7_9BACT|nr:GDSL-type esterase/lipase family protein [Mesomycoplasma ovipneumoniae]MDF9627379.1 GDSL-type esterase/lipase family protein [Mesomycoplasma ovipneumoniae]MDO4157510.1 GDSL-type esterase/lipase family protein [Mesomycoplasma ovipneumoniae]MDO4158597.1 GDSL-type esterase/lipase family protein [Mesomycoplasma ovipneumoniae]MDO6821517.1 GDSL-type esterase/lipase family protein [Mesomycoplasma ovipneumoniae]MDO6855975.1 GDSL-type esterase/lipase family protein [Mesomycoplasma ovipneumoniae]
MKKSISKPDFSKAFKIFLSFSTLSLTISGITLIGIKNRDKIDQINIPITHSAQETEELLDKINYLSLGDSISAGFNWDYSFDVRGMLDENNQVKGLSYPAFFANFIQKVNPNALKSFDNLALSWTTVTDWLYLLNPENEKYKNSDKTHFRFNYHLDKKLNSPYGQQIREVFDDFSATSFPKLHKKIQDSNLITLSLGANDLIESIDFRVIAKPLQKLATKAEASFEFMQNIELAYQKIYRNLLTLVENLRKINPNVRIVLVGYNSLTSNIVKFFEKLLTNEIGLPENYANLAIKRLNSTIKQVAKVQKVQYVDLYNEKVWQENPTEFASKELDIHPSTKGYKKMAQDLLFKLALEQDILFKNEEHKKLGWDKDYIEKDLNNYRRTLNIASNSQILEALSLEGSTDKFISETSQIETRTAADIQKTEKSPIENFVNVILNNNFGDFLSRFVQLGLQNNPGVQKTLTDFWQQNQKAGASFAQILQKIFSSGFFSQIITRFQSYVQNIIDTQNWEKATISDLVNQIFADFDEKQIIDVLNTVVTSEFASENPEKTKELIFASIFGQSLVQDLIINNIIQADVAYKDNLKVVFTFDSIRKLFTKIITDFQLRTKDYENSATFQQIIQTYLENPQNDADNVSFIRNFISETLKHHDSVKVLVGIINDNFNFNLSKDDQDSLTDLLVSLADVIVRTNVWTKLNDIAAKNFLEVIKKSNYKNIESISSIFADQIYTNYTSFFKDSKNLLDLFHELLSFELSNNQIESLKKLLNKFYPILTKFDLSNFIDSSSPNYASFSFLFDSVKDFLVSNSFKPLSDIVNSAINDFLINKSQYKRIDDLNRFGFQFLANNLPKLEENIYDFLAKNVQNENFLNSLIGLISNSLSDQGLKPKSVKTFSEIIRLIFEDFYAKYQVWKEDKTSPTNNLIFEFVKGAINTFETFTKSNFTQYDSLKTNLESARKANNESEIQEYSAKITLLDQQLSFQNFSSYFLNNFFSQEQIYSLLKSLASLDFRSKISTHDLVLFFKNLFDQSFLHKQLIEKLNQNSFFNKEKIQKPLLNILSSFFESSEVEKLLSKLIDYFFDDKKFEEHPDFSSLIQNFITQNSELIEKVFTLFLGNTTTWESISQFLRAILDEYKLNLKPESVDTILELVRDFLTKLKDSILSIQGETTIQPPLTIKSIITIILDAISNNPTPNKSVIETLFDSFSVDIANNYYSPEATSKQDPSKITPDKISTLIAEVMKTEPISEQIKSSLSSIPEGYREDIVPIFDSFLQSDGLKDLFNSYFKIVAKAKINKPLNNLSLIKSLFEKQHFNKIIGEFIVQLDEKKNNLTDNFAKLAGKIFKTEFEQKEFEPFFKLIKKIIQNNIDSYYTDEPESIDIFSEEQPEQINVNQDIADFPIIARLFSDTGSEQDYASSSSTETQKENPVKKDPNYSKENAFLTKIITILSKFTNGQFATSNLNSLLESEIGNEAFIVDLVKQIASVYDQIDKSEKDNIWNILTKIFTSDFFKEKINLLSVGNISSFSIFSGLSEENKKKIEPTFKSLLLDFLPNPANKLFIFRILDYINKNQELFKEVKTFSGILTKFLGDDKTQSSQSQNNTQFLKNYLWHVLNFLVKHEGFLDIAVDVIASYLNLNLESNPNLTKKVQNPREIPKTFLKEFIGLGFDNPLISDILDQMLAAVKTLDSGKEASSFFSAIFSKLDFAKLINLDLVVKIEPKISTDDSTGKVPTEQNLIDEQNLSLKTPEGQKISVKSLADFFDLIFLASPDWDNKNENKSSPILKELNHITYTGISFQDLFTSNKKDPQLEAISKLFHRIWYSEGKDSNRISISNFKDSSKGRLLYRLALILLFYTYESRISQNWLKSQLFYGSFLSSWKASEIIRASLHNGSQSKVSNSNDREYKKFIDDIIGEPAKARRWWGTTWYDSRDVKLNDMITMIYYNSETNRFFSVTKQPKLKDQILQQIRDGTYPENYTDPKK